MRSSRIACRRPPRPEGDPAPLPYLDFDEDRGFDITLEVFITSQRMRDRNDEPLRLSRGNFRDMYWTVAQLVAHHTSNGCNLRAGDLLASGTVSGRERVARMSARADVARHGADPPADR